jgi:cell division transport system permease protein
LKALAHIVKELMRNLFGHPGAAFGSFMSLTLLFLLFDLFWIAAGTSERFYTRLLSEMEMELFVEAPSMDSTQADLRPMLEAVDGVKSVTFISSEQARRRLTDLIGTDLLVGYDSANPLPASYVLTFEVDALTTDAMTTIETKVLQMDRVEFVFYGQQWLAKAEETRAIILSLGMILGGLILMATLIGSANNIRLMTQTRAVGFRQMQILGAGRMFLAAPFLLEGLVISSLSGAAGWAAVLYVYSRVSFARFELILPSLQEMTIFVGVVSFVGLVSGYLGIRKRLR